MYDKVIFHDLGKMEYCTNIDKIKSMNISENDNLSINDVIELYEIELCFKKCPKKSEWSNDEYIDFKTKATQLAPVYKKYFNTIRIDNLIQQYPEIDTYYVDDFWDIFDNLKIFNRFNDDQFRELIHLPVNVRPGTIFSHEKIVQRFGIVLKDYIFEYEDCIKLIISYFNQDTKKIYIPEQISNEDLNNYLLKYIRGEKVNTNILQEIVSCKKNHVHEVYELTRYKAHNRYYEEVNAAFDSKKYNVFKQTIQINYSKDIPKFHDVEYNDRCLCLTYNNQWLRENVDVKLILFNFMYVFEYVDNKMRFNLCKNKEDSVFYSLFCHTSDKEFNNGFTFKNTQELYLHIIRSYIDLLKDLDVHLEDIIEEFFGTYIPTEFGIPAIKISMPSQGTSFHEKCALMCLAFESVLKQFDMFKKYNEIDLDFIAFSSNPIDIDKISSLVNNKYIYIHNDEMKTALQLLFSNQSSLLYRKVENESDDRIFYDELLNNKICIDDFYDHQLDDLEVLRKLDLIEYEKNKVTVTSKTKCSILQDLYENNVICKYHCNEEEKYIIEDMIKKKLLIEKSTLFTDLELNYLHYLWDNKKYINSLELRNKYLHGALMGADEEIHQTNYYVIMNLFVMLVLKINDDLCLYYDNKKVP